MSENREYIWALCNTIGRPVDLSPYQWAQLIAYAVEYNPDLIIELGRADGNSTCAFTQAANWIGSHPCRVVSVCTTNTWQNVTARKLVPIVGKDWFRSLQVHQADILAFDFKKALDHSNRILIFWDAHGYDIAERVMGDILPSIQERDHVVIMHDLSDARYVPSSYDQYGEHGIWKSNSDGSIRLRIGVLNSAVEQAVSITDFTVRNKIPLHSAAHSLHQELDTEKQETLRRMLGDQFYSLNAHWFWFSLNDALGPLTFPKYRLPEERRGPVLSLRARMKIALKILLNRYPLDKFQ